jgi:hypothetical protein
MGDVEGADPVVGLCIAFGDGEGGVFRVVIDDDALPVAVGLLDDAVEGRGEKRLGVIGGHDNRDERHYGFPNAPSRGRGGVDAVAPLGLTGGGE